MSHRDRDGNPWPSETNRHRPSRATGRQAAIRAAAQTKRIESLKIQIARVERSMLTPLQRMRIKNGHGPDSALPHVGPATPRDSYCMLIERPDPEVRRAARRRRSEFMRMGYYAEREIVVIRLPWDGPCGVCGRAIDPEQHHGPNGEQNGLARSLGHEPPKSTLRSGDTLYLRPEHWRCNWLKGTLTDTELGITSAVV